MYRRFGPPEDALTDGEDDSADPPLPSSWADRVVPPSVSTQLLDLPLDDARSTFKSKAQTKKGKNKYLGIFVVLLFGSFVIPMVQYFWYVRDTPDSLFGNNEPPPPPPPPPKKNFWER